MGGQQFGIPPKQIVELAYTGADLALTPVTEANRNPTVNDKNYPIDCFWRNTSTRVLWWLSGFDSTGALWINISASGSGLLSTLSDTAGTKVSPDVSSNIQLASTNSNLLIVSNPGSNQINFSFSNVASGTAMTVGAVTADVITLALGATPGVYQFNVRVAAFDAVTPLGAGYELVFPVRTTGIASTIVGTPTEIVAEEGALSAGGVSIVASANNMIVRVLGTAGKTIDWKSDLTYTFVS